MITNPTTITAKQPRDRALERPVPALLQRQQPEGDDARHQAADRQRQPEQQVERHRAADHLGEVGGDRDALRLHPQPDVDLAGEGVAADLGQVAAGREAELRRQRLDQHRGDVGRDDHPQQQVAVLRALRRSWWRSCRGRRRRWRRRTPARAAGRSRSARAGRAAAARTAFIMRARPRAPRDRAPGGSAARRAAWSRPSNRTHNGPPNGPALDHDQGQAGYHAEVGQVRQRGAVPVLHALDPELHADARRRRAGCPSPRRARRRSAGSGRRAGRASAGRAGSSMRSSSRSDTACSRASASSCTSCGPSPTTRTRKVSSSRCRRTTCRAWPGAVRRERRAVVRCARRARVRRACLSITDTVGGATPRWRARADVLTSSPRPDSTKMVRSASSVGAVGTSPQHARDERRSSIEHLSRQC